MGYFASSSEESSSKLHRIEASLLVWITKWTSLASVLLRDESDALHKINNYIYKDTEYKYFGC